MIIHSKRVYINNKFIEASIRFNDDLILDIDLENKLEVDVDYGDMMIVPGFYDLHTHGYLGYDCLDDNPEGLTKWLDYLPSEGVCGFLPTITSSSKENIIKAIENIEKVKSSLILGVHLEGPYFSSERNGAQNTKYLKHTDVEEFKEINKNNQIKVITLASEVDSNHQLIKYCQKTGVKVSLGHSNADIVEVKKAIEDGADGFTHAYNGMSGLKHRNGGLVNQILAGDEYSEIICDGLHSSIDAIKIFYKCKKDKAIAISDSLSIKGMPVGYRTDFADQEIYLDENGLARIVADDTIAGSTLKLNDALKILVNKCNIDIGTALNSLTINPMKYLNIKDRGLIDMGQKANIVILNNDFEVIKTYCCR